MHVHAYVRVQHACAHTSYASHKLQSVGESRYGFPWLRALEICTKRKRMKLAGYMSYIARLLFYAENGVPLPASRRRPMPRRAARCISQRAGDVTFPRDNAGELPVPVIRAHTRKEERERERGREREREKERERERERGLSSFLLLHPREILTWRYYTLATLI